MSVIYGLATRWTTVNSQHIDFVLQVNRQTMDEIFPTIFGIFLVLGTVVGIVVISYMVYNAYKYRESAGRGGPESERPQLGELPHGGGGGKKLVVSLTISAIIVIALVAGAYTLLDDVEAGPSQAADPIEIKVVGIQFSWQYIYPNGHTTSTLRVPEDRAVVLSVTSRDVFHTYGIPEYKVKTDAIPGQTTDTWFRPDRTGTYEAQCFELCGTGHSVMESKVIVMEPTAFEQWYAQTGSGPGNNSTSSNGSSSNSTDTTDSHSMAAVDDSASLSLSVSTL